MIINYLILLNIFYFQDYESDFEDEFSENISIEKEDEEIKEFSKNNYEKETNENIPSLNVIKSINEEDRKLDSGSYEMIERRRLRMAIERENAALRYSIIYNYYIFFFYSLLENFYKNKFSFKQDVLNSSIFHIVIYFLFF